jgi:UDP-3-O-[3-hydroxymyristoyl] glucosamine N-acyltransferase LpxD
MKSKSIKISDLVSFANGVCSIKIINPAKEEDLIIGISPINESYEHTLTWTKKNKVDFKKLKARILIAPEDIELENSDGVVVLATSNPRFLFAKILNEFFAFQETKEIHSSAIISPYCKIGDNVSIGPFSVIEGNVEIGDNVVVDSHCHIKKGTVIGSNSIIGSSTIIGNDGFGLEFEKDGKPFRFTHIGGVSIGKHTTIGSLVTICKGTLTNTTVGNYVHIDDHVHIAHNVIIGDNTIITACAEISGSCEIGANVWISPNSSINDYVKIGDKAFVGIGSVVTKKIIKSGLRVFGNPSFPLNNCGAE